MVLQEVRHQLINYYYYYYYYYYYCQTTTGGVLSSQNYYYYYYYLKEEMEASTCEAKKCLSQPGIEPWTCGLHDQCSTAWAIGTKHDSKQKTDTIKQHTHWQRLLQTSSFLAILPSPRGPATVTLLQTSSAQRRFINWKSWEIDKFKRRKGSRYVWSENMPVPTRNRTQDLWFTWPMIGTTKG